jgi:hypothetical protein
MAARLFEPRTLRRFYLALALLAETDDGAVLLSEHGAPRGGALPFLAGGSLSHLAANGYVTRQREATGWRLGYGLRAREIAATWWIELPAGIASAAEATSDASRVDLPRPWKSDSMNRPPGGARLLADVDVDCLGCQAPQPASVSVDHVCADVRAVPPALSDRERDLVSVGRPGRRSRHV